ncbi:MAG: PAS domain-containing protein, partial [Burkholderiales bacterium]
RESARFQSLSDYFWYGIAGATGIVLVLGAVVGWSSRRALLSEVHDISRTASAIVDGDLSRRLATRGGSTELDTLARTVNGMLERLARQNVQLEGEIAVRRHAEQALHRAHDSLEELVEQRTAQLARVNESLHRSEAFLAEGQRISRTGSWGWDLSTGKVIWSEEQYRLLGFEPGEVEPSVSAFLNAVHSEDRSGIQQKLEEAMREKRSYAIDYRVALRDGTVRHMRSVGRSVQRESDNVEEYIGVTTDVTGRKRAEDELRRQKAHVDELFDLAPDAIVLTDLSGPSIIRVNHEFTRMFGYTSDEAVGHRLRTLIAPDELHPANLTHDPELLAGHKVEREVVRRRKDGTRFHAHITAARIRFEDVQDAAYVTYRDVSERKCAEAILAGENRILEMIAKGSPLEATLDSLCRLMEEVFCGCLASIILIDPDGRLRHGAAPSLPESYTAAFEGSAVGACSGPCGVAAHRREAVIVSDIETYPYWEHYRSVAAAHGLRACWSTPVFSSEGKVLGTFAIFYREPRSPSAQEQITIQQFSHLASIVIERTEAVNALRRSDERFALAVAASMDGIWEWDIVKDQMFFSERTQRIYGLEPGVSVRPRAEWGAMIQMHPEDAEAQLRTVEDYLSGSRPAYEGEWRVRHADGVYRWVRIRGLCERDEAARAIRMAGSVSDINTRKCAEEALRASEQRYALAMGAAGEGHWDWNIVTNEYYASPRMLEMYGFAPGTTFADRTDFLRRFPFHPDDRPKWENAAAAHFAGATERFDLEIRMIPRGEIRWVHLTGICSRDASGKPVRWTGSVTDVTDRKRVEEALLESERQLRRAQRLEAVGTLAGGIAHDFNNILGAILGYGEMAVRDAPKGSRLRRDLDSIVSAGERGRALVDRILAFSRSGVGERIAVHVEAVVREALDLLAAKLPTGITIEARLNAGRAAMLGDPTQVHQVLMNLATNGVQAMSGGGVLRVLLHACRFDEERVATIGTIAAGDYVVLQVADEGSGIAPDVLERIFDPFFTTKDVGVGTGLGLSLVHGIVTEVGGSIDVESAPGTGSVFTVYFRREGDASESAEDQLAAVPLGQRQKVLVVDDEEPLVNLATRALEDLGYVPVGFTSSTAALEALRAEPQRFDAIITDERMPGLSGSALIREVRAIRSSIPILLVSGYVGGMVTSRAYNSGATEVLKKPLSARELATTLARVFDAQ